MADQKVEDEVMDAGCFAAEVLGLAMSRKPEMPKVFYREFAPGVPNVRAITEADARSRKREILMAYPSATVRIEKRMNRARGEIGGAAVKERS